MRPPKQETTHRVSYQEAVEVSASGSLELMSSQKGFRVIREGMALGKLLSLS